MHGDVKWLSNKCAPDMCRNDLKQTELLDFHRPFGSKLPAGTRWAKLSATIPWGEIEEAYKKSLDGTGMGAPAKSGRIVEPVPNGGVFRRLTKHGVQPPFSPMNSAQIRSSRTFRQKQIPSTRGMLDDTLVLFTSEFGRTPFTQSGADQVGTGRDHNQVGFSCWMAGAGLKHGITYGATDDVGYKSVVDPVPWYDFHATVLHLLGINHEELTYYHNGIQRRLTDVHGKLIDGILA